MMLRTRLVVVDPRSLRVRLRWKIPAAATFAAPSTALLYGSDYWASSFRGDRVVRLGPAPGRAGSGVARQFSLRERRPTPRP